MKFETADLFIFLYIYTVYVLQGNVSSTAALQDLTSRHVGVPPTNMQYMLTNAVFVLSIHGLINNVCLTHTCKQFLNHFVREREEEQRITSKFPTLTSSPPPPFLHDIVI
jgi:hypothetical protein